MFFIVIEDRRFVLTRPRPFPRLVALPENIQQPAIRDLGRIIVNLDRFAMVPQVVIGGILGCSSCVSNPGPNNAVNAPELSIRTPKSAQGKGGCLHLCWHVEVHRRWENRVHQTAFCCFHLIPLICPVVPVRTIARSQQDYACQENHL